MYGKIFKHAFERSMMGAGSHVFAVMGYVIAHTVKSRVELNPKLLAAVIGDSEERMEQAIKFLCLPDPKSTNPAHEGRRLVAEGQFQYFVPSHEIYSQIRNNDDLREANRIRQANWRARQAQKKKLNIQPPEDVNNAPHNNGPKTLSLTERISMERELKDVKEDLKRLEAGKPYPPGDPKLRQLSDLRETKNKLRSALRINPDEAQSQTTQ